jgi:hypothetical protein
MVGIEIAIEEMRGMGKQGKQGKIREKSFSSLLPNLLPLFNAQCPMLNAQCSITVCQLEYK